ncbi:hypothetical protein [Caudoviricetes sp.]|nr:hypothetical protein [Caudoviricetes sp.]
MDIFSRVANQKEQNDRDTLPPVGTYEVVITHAELFDTRKLGKAARVEWAVLSSTNPQVKPTNKFGEVFFIGDSNTDNADGAAGRLRKLVRAMTGLPKDVDAAELTKNMQAIFSAAQAGKGVKVRVMVVLNQSKKTGKLHPNAQYSELDQDDSDIIAMRQAIESGKFIPTPYVPAAAVLDEVVTQPAVTQAQPAAVDLPTETPSLLSRRKG